MPYMGKSVIELISLPEWTLKEKTSFGKSVANIEKLWQKKKKEQT